MRREIAPKPPRARRDRGLERLTQPLTLLALGLTLSFAGACRQPHTPEGKPPKGEARAQAKVQLPDPVPLPAEPPAASWIAAPNHAISMLRPYSPIPIEPVAAVEQALAGLTDPALAGELARAVDLGAPFSNVVLHDQEIIRLSIKPDALGSLRGQLAQLPPAGEFGAVKLTAQGAASRDSSREWLAWIDEADGNTLVLANTLPGLVTARGLAKAYGQQPIYFTADPSALPIPVEVPFARVTGRGDIEAVVIEAQAIAGQDPLAQLPISPGTLGGLLEGPNMVAGGSGRYADHQDMVREVTSQINANVRELPFLVRSVGEDLAAKINTLLRTWDGRVLVALGPAKHLRFAYGANDVSKSQVATIRLLQKVVDSVSLARNFVSIPKMSLRRRVTKGDGQDVEVFVVHDAASLGVSELRPLIDGEGRLNIAMAWSARAGGGMLVIGPDAANQLAGWLDQTAKSPAHAATSGQLLAASFAGDPAQLQGLLQASPEALDVGKLLQLDATGPKWQVGVERRDGGLYVIDVRSPGPPKPARVKPK
ncbi:hypothetical protein DB30_01066 [Enhygromyxa salina]|uniref:Uncharacterized protein n=1 Tax=Enhygromyxa salina TaxID=215803 RepID=A0A0C1ZNV4_9BACT|nr:hypothetical protein [Enhygromyxa salina]KIG12708.1 hypothetical protein DB30_01066 [Enhygromyxa salina]